MRPAHAIIAWTPAASTWIETCGHVIVGRWVPRRAPHWALKHDKLAGATSRTRRVMTDPDALRALELDFRHLIRDGIEPNVINAAFSAIDGWVTR